VNRSHFYTTGLVILLLAITANTVLVLNDHGRIGRNETQTCVIQARGLKGQPHLTAIMRDIAVLLTPLPGVHAAVPRPFVAPLANLREQVGAYLAIENEQPSGRSC
jgi:hypothetical protein